MDDFPHHHLSFNHHHKRKVDAEDGPDPSSSDPLVPSDSILVDSTSSVSTCTPINAPRLSWFNPDTPNNVWNSPATPTSPSPLSEVSFSSTPPHSPLSIPEVPYPPQSVTPPKRPRLERPQSSALRPPLKRSSKRHVSATVRPSMPSAVPPRRSRRLAGDIPDTGIVPITNPGPTSGSLLRSTTITTDLAAKSIHNLPSPLPFVPIDPSSPYIPSPQPLINRQTLKELDLDAILRNPQLRHDLLFDAGLQFRPTSSRRKREMAENYWSAITRELESGCTCISFDLRGKPHELVCACGQVSLPSLNPILAFSSSLHVVTLRMPTRILPLLTEFLEVLLSVIQPLSNISGLYVNPNTFQAQMQEHAAQAAYMRSVFDPELIEQELKHELFDPSGLFQSIGRTLKSHCAPMRDRAVEAMIAVAQTCAPGGGGTKTDAVKAVRMCMDILELMKLDIANHQLQTLRPFLVRTSGQFELKTFRTRRDNGSSLQVTRDWLRAAHRDLLASDHPIPHSLFPPDALNFRTLQRNQQAYLSVLRALTDLVFEPPSSAPPALLPHPTISPHSQIGLPVISALPGYPETSYLDNARLLVLTTDAADAVTLYMFLLLYRQLLFSDLCRQPSHAKPKVGHSDLLKLKKEIRDIGGCYPSREKPPDGTTDNPVQKQDGKDGSGGDRWRNVKQDIILQIAMRAHEARINAAERTRPSPTDHPPIGPLPDDRMLKLAERWSEENMKPGSPLSVVLRTRLRDVVFNAVVNLSYPARDCMTGKFPAANFKTFGVFVETAEMEPGTATGMEPLVDEIRSLAEKLSRLSLIHLNAYLPLYEQRGFLDS